MNSKPIQKQVSLDEVLSAAMLKKEKNAGEALPTKAKNAPSTSIPANSTTRNVKAVKKITTGITKKRAAATTSSNQLTITEMIKSKKAKDTSKMEVQSEDESEYAEFKLPLLSALPSSEPKTAEEYEMCLSLSSDPGEDSQRSCTLNNAPSKAVVTSDILLVGPSKPVNKVSTKPQHVLDTSKAANKNEPLKPNSEANSKSLALKPTPIFISDSENCNFNSLNTMLKDLIGDTYITKSNKNGFCVKCNNMDSYKKLIGYLNDNQCKIVSHTYQIRQERGFRGVIRHLHKLTPMNWIREQLAKLGFQVRFLNVIRNRYNKEPLHLFEVELEKCDKSTVEAFLQLNKLGNQQVAVEKLLRQNTPQCHRCQRFGHTKNYCLRPFVCVKCAGEHPSTECIKSKDEEAKCANCKGRHTASYRGCPAYKEAAKLNWPGHTVNTNDQRMEQNHSDDHQPLPKKSAGPLITNKSITAQNIMTPYVLGSQTQESMRKASYASVVANSQHHQLPPSYQKITHNRKLLSNLLPRRIKDSQTLNTNNVYPRTEKKAQTLSTPSDLTGNLTLKLDNFITFIKSSQKDSQQQMQTCYASINEGINKLSGLIQMLVNLMSTLSQVSKHQNAQTTE